MLLWYKLNRIGWDIRHKMIGNEVTTWSVDILNIDVPCGESMWMNVKI